MLGNDVVDLLDTDSRPESYRPRFDARVFAESERRAIARDVRTLSRRWAHWGAKEAAYKLARRIEPGFVFQPKRLVVEFEPVSRTAGRRLERCGRLELSPAAGWEAPETLILEIRSFETPERVHVIALPAGADWGAVDADAVELDPIDADPSEAVRVLAKRAVARSLAVPEARLAIGRRRRIPTIELDGVETSLSLSLSHHGRWVAYAMTPWIDDQSLSWTSKNRACAPPTRSGATSWQTP
jgi:hypothetical protein